VGVFCIYRVSRITYLVVYCGLCAAYWSRTEQCERQPCNFRVEASQVFDREEQRVRHSTGNSGMCISLALRLTNWAALVFNVAVSTRQEPRIGKFTASGMGTPGVFRVALFFV
jgi:hypothetical protein